MSLPSTPSHTSNAVTAGVEVGLNISLLSRVLDDYSQNNYGLTETRDGYITQGEYFVNLPDGRLQKVKHSTDRTWAESWWCQVTYTVDGDAGYVADIVYTGEAQYPPEPAGGYPGRK